MAKVCTCSVAHDKNRRMFMKRVMCAVAGTAAGTLLSVRRTIAGEKRPEIKQPVKADKQHLMKRAFAMRRKAVQSGDQPFGAVIVKNGRIVGEGPSRVITNQDPTAHGEMEAIRDACRRLGTRNLSGCELYTSFRPCPMCETASYWANLSRIYHGAEITDAGAPRYPQC